jgi:hypothetical protein
LTRYQTGPLKGEKLGGIIAKDTPPSNPLVMLQKILTRLCCEFTTINKSQSQIMRKITISNVRSETVAWISEAQPRHPPINSRHSTPEQTLVGFRSAHPTYTLRRQPMRVFNYTSTENLAFQSD